MKILALNLAAALSLASAPADAAQADTTEGTIMPSSSIQTGPTPFDFDAREAQVASSMNEAQNAAAGCTLCPVTLHDDY